MSMNILYDGSIIHIVIITITEKFVVEGMKRLFFQVVSVTL